ncbi:MAG TPA: NADH-quinone oxidoreductase subunit J [Rectinemataceae bacterium]|nr:NADH-quinone oxidoreductase subunit J [Rectinemataceae bacterium]
MLENALFYIFSALIVGCALAMVVSRNLVRSALFMAATFLGMALIFLLLHAEYLAVVQIMVYVGAISILFVFGIMLTKRERMEDTNGFNRYALAAAVVGLGVFALLARAVVVSSAALLRAAAGAAAAGASAVEAAGAVATGSGSATAVAAAAVAGAAATGAAQSPVASPAAWNSAAAISGVMLGPLALPLEASALLLLAALVGAIVMGKGTRKNR